ncbi:hypothetical protein KP509_26G024500 [Ceratopteris richardii]|uniref:Aspartic peptidase DDI1-type domain-containing protein n=1 Tax=Ceratopteris richardii TaxID=49495 RepID=A0A8T2RLK2_CERRI|nr:hypothetical protein KP509_26G024500 [Ceratopteris richardii]
MVFRSSKSREQISSSMHFVEADQENAERKSEYVANEKIHERSELEEEMEEFYEKKESREGDEVEILPPITKKLVPSICPFPERLKIPKHKKERQSEEKLDIMRRLAKMDITLHLDTLLKCSPIFSGAQLDSGAVVNLMTEYMMKALGLTQMEHTPMPVKMANQTQVKPASLLKNVNTIIGGLEFNIDYLIVRPRNTEATFFILLGRTCFIIVGPKSDRVRIQVSSNSTSKRLVTNDELEKKAKETETQEKV